MAELGVSLRRMMYYGQYLGFVCRTTIRLCGIGLPTPVLHVFVRAGSMSVPGEPKRSKTAAVRLPDKDFIVCVVVYNIAAMKLLIIVEEDLSFQTYQCLPSYLNY